MSTFAGLRGGVSLAVALSVPTDVPARDFIIFVVAGGGSAVDGGSGDAPAARY